MLTIHKYTGNVIKNVFFIPNIIKDNDHVLGFFFFANACTKSHRRICLRFKVFWVRSHQVCTREKYTVCYSTQCVEHHKNLSTGSAENTS